MARAEQAGLPGIPQAPKRKVIDALEDLCIKRDKLAGKRTAIADQVAEASAEIQAKLVELKLEVYTYEDDRRRAARRPRRGQAQEAQEQAQPEEGEEGRRVAMSASREMLVKIAREAAGGVHRPSYCENPASFDPHEWVLEAMQRAFAEGCAAGRRLEHEDTIAAVLT